ncbi:MAG: NifU family protein [Geothrix sp.]|nr:MAG: NifU family protein [Geothrix sp.]
MDGNQFPPLSSCSDRHEKQVMIRMDALGGGACGSCPVSLTGTLVAIEGMLQKEVDPEIVVISV